MCACMYTMMSNTSYVFLMLYKHIIFNLLCFILQIKTCILPVYIQICSFSKNGIKNRGALFSLCLTLFRVLSLTVLGFTFFVFISILIKFYVLGSQIKLKVYNNIHIYIYTYIIIRRALLKRKKNY